MWSVPTPVSIRVELNGRVPACVGELLNVWKVEPGVRSGSRGETQELLLTQSPILGLHHFWTVIFISIKSLTTVHSHLLQFVGQVQNQISLRAGITSILSFLVDSSGSAPVLNRGSSQ